MKSCCVETKKSKCHFSLHISTPPQQDAAAVSVKSEPTEKECANKKKTNNSVPPDPGPQHNSTDSSDSCDDDDDDDDQGSIVDELEVGLFSNS